MSTLTQFVRETNIRIDDEALLARARAQSRSRWHRHLASWYEENQTARGLPRFSFAMFDDARFIGYVDDDCKSLLRSIESAMKRVAQSAAKKVRYGSAQLAASEVPAEAAIQLDYAQGRLTLYTRQWSEVPLGARTKQTSRKAGAAKSKSGAKKPAKASRS